jgi:hypothetical protein
MVDEPLWAMALLPPISKVKTRAYSAGATRLRPDSNMFIVPPGIRFDNPEP